MPMRSCGKVRVGSRIAVWCQKDRCYYACTVLKKMGACNFLVEYEDSSEEWTNLTKQKFRWQEFYIETEDEADPQEITNPEEEEDQQSNSSEKDKEQSPDEGEANDDEASEVTDPNDGGDDANKEDSKAKSDDESETTSNGKRRNKKRDDTRDEDDDDDEGDKDSNVATKEGEKKESGGKKCKEQRELDDEKKKKKAESGDSKDEEEDRRSEKLPSKSKKRKADVSTAELPANAKQMNDEVMKDTDDGSEATPIQQREEEEAPNLVTPPTPKRQKLSAESTKQRDGKAVKVDEEADNVKSDTRGNSIDGQRNSDKNDDAGDAKDDDTGGEVDQKMERVTKRKADSRKKGANKLSPTRSGHKKGSPTSPKTVASKKTHPTIKEMKVVHDSEKTSKGDAILSVMIVYLMMGIENLSYEQIASDLGQQPTEKSLEKAWKALKSEILVEQDKKIKEIYRLTQKGIDKIASEDYIPPKTTAELHEVIKANVINEYGIKIIDLLLCAKEKGESILPQNLEAECDCNDDIQNFSDALTELKERGFVVPDPKAKRKLILSDKCFLD